MGHYSRQKCIDFIRTTKPRDWKGVEVIAFDAPQATDKPYSDRLKLLQESKYTFYLKVMIIAIPSNHPVISLVKPITCQSRTHLEEVFNDLFNSNEKAQGIVVRDPKAWYFQPNTFYTKNVSYYWFT
jgi:hypothetical protein